jgi:hypothetical protein
MTKLSNISIGKKLGLLVGVSGVQLLCIAGLAVWAMRSLDTAMDAANVESRKMVLAKTVTTDNAAVVVQVGDMVIARRFLPEAWTNIQALRKEYLGALEEIRAQSVAAEGKRLLAEIDTCSNG